MDNFSPRYLAARETGVLADRIRLAESTLTRCSLCPRQCRTDRAQGKTGFCATPARALVSSFAPHFGEEPPISGTQGSGTIFFSHCNLKCCFCQNYDISILGRGEPATTDQLASTMLFLQRIRCHNINFVTPTHVVPFILKALDKAAENGLNIPLVYNSSGYDSLETLKLLDGIMDIYMPDFKFWDPRVADQACQAPDYPEIARIAVKEMHRQAGDLKTDDRGIAQSGLLVRHLVLPDNLAGTRDVMAFLARQVSPDTRVNIMSQYRPMGQAKKIPALSRAVSAEEVHGARKIAKDLGLVLIR